jgi:hypothetical protein
MDYIYLGRFDYALPISYTGLPNESALTFSSEYYTNAPRLFSPVEIRDVSAQTGAFIVLDDMSIARSEKNMVKYIQKYGQLVFEDANETGQKIRVYKLFQQNP